MRIEFGLKLLGVIQEYKGKIQLAVDAPEFLSGEFTREEIDYMLTLMGIRDSETEKGILPERLRTEE